MSHCITSSTYTLCDALFKAGISSKIKTSKNFPSKASAERYNLLMKQFAEKENITEDLKATNQLEWVGKMNANKNAVEEIILKELIYV